MRALRLSLFTLTRPLVDGARSGDGLRSDCGRAIAAVREGRVAEGGSPERKRRGGCLEQRARSAGPGESCLSLGRANPSATPGGRAHPGAERPSPDLAKLAEGRSLLPVEAAIAELRLPR
jgi:hypothetical protein